MKETLAELQFLGNEKCLNKTLKKVLVTTNLALDLEILENYRKR